MSIPILYLSSLGGLGGGETSLLTHILALDRSQFRPHVICGAPGGFVDELCRHDVPTAVIPFRLPRLRGVVPSASIELLPRLEKYLRAHAIAIVHANDPEIAYYAVPIARLRGIPVVWTMWGWWQAERGWKAIFYERMVSHIIAPTRLLKSSLVQANARLQDRITVLPFGVDTEEFAPGPRDEGLLDEWQIDHDAPIVTVLARFQSVKGHARFLDAALPILDAFPSARFLFVGDNEFDTRDANETRDKIRLRVGGDERLKQSVVFCGFRRDIPHILRMTDVLVCPSDFETYGIANLEAMACGVPVVSTNVGGPSETLLESETGFLVPPGEPEAMADRVIELLAQPALRKVMGERGRRRVEHHFALKSSAARLAKLYLSLVPRAG